jgi:DNA polymerase-3 subunit gamma/tau
VLARKWRPAQFADIVGQAPVVRTLMNAIRSDRIHQAYLFTGSRGIGKTSVARIIAKVMRCEQTTWDGQWLKSCDQCSSCQEVSRGSSVDVIEIDGASNNGVDHVREIRESAKFMPASGKRKIYIIDEVHMLSTAAFNALLKTLEEPPPHVVFIFATTEPHKIPATILSRVQRFDLRRVSVAQIQARLTQVLQAEKIEAEPGALALVARAAEGGLRDALSLLDQVIAFSGEKISVSSVRESIGLIESQLILSVLRAILDRKPLDGLAAIQGAFEQGHDLKLLARHLIEYLHALILAKVGAGADRAGEYSESEWQEIKVLSGLRELEELELIFQALHQGIEWIARSPQPKTVLDVLLIKCATAQALVSISSPAAPGSLSAKPAPSNARITTAPEGSQTSPQPLVKDFEELIARVRSTRPFIATALENGFCSQFPSQAQPTLVIQFPKEVGFYREQLQHRTHSDSMNQLLRESFGRMISVQIEVVDYATGESIAARREREGRERELSARQAAQNHPVIREAQALFGGELGPIEIMNGGGHAGKH